MDSADSDETVALTQSDPSLRLVLLVGVCAYTILAVYLLKDKHAKTLSFSERRLLNRIPLKEEV